MKHTIIFIFSFFCIVLAEEKHSFRLEDGSKVIGYIVSEDEDIYELDTKFGLIQIEKKDIKKFECIYFLNDGNVLVGNKISSSDSEVILNTVKNEKNPLKLFETLQALVLLFPKVLSLQGRGSGLRQVHGPSYI